MVLLRGENNENIGGDNKITSKGTLISIQLRIVDHFVSTRPSNDSNERLSYNRYYLMSGKGFFHRLAKFNASAVS